MAKSSKATRGSKAKPRAAKRAPIKAQKKPAARSEASVRSAPTAKKARPAPARPASARPASARPAPARPAPAKPAVVLSSPLFLQLNAEEQRAVRQALSGKPTLLEGSPRARD